VVGGQSLVKRDSLMKKNLITAVLMTIATTVLLGILYPLLVTGLAQVLFPKQANGQLIQRDGVLVGSHLIGQPFSGPGYFHSRPSAAGAAGYDASASSGSNLGPTNAQLIARVNGDVAKLQAENPGVLVPVDLVTTSGSGLDPDVSPAAAEFQIRRVAAERKISEAEIARLVQENSISRQWGFLGEPRVNVLDLNLVLDARYGRLH
jgi:K+-transporting ATPase ATPase C chain